MRSLRRRQADGGAFLVGGSNTTATSIREIDLMSRLIVASKQSQRADAPMWLGERGARVQRRPRPRPIDREDHSRVRTGVARYTLAGRGLPDIWFLLRNAARVAIGWRYPATRRLVAQSVEVSRECEFGPSVAIR